jgi:carbon monoxide dehydrogenase subunit G
MAVAEAAGRGTIMEMRPVDIEVRAEIAAPPDEVWGTIRSFERIEDYLPLIESSSVEGEGVGATRVCVTQDGRELEERLVALDDKRRRLTYSIISSPMPIENYLSTVAVEDGQDGGSLVSWGVRFDAPEKAAADFEAGMRQTYQSGLQGLRELHEKG